MKEVPWPLGATRGLVPAAGIGPATHGVKARRSTTELHRPACVTRESNPVSPRHQRGAVTVWLVTHGRRGWARTTSLHRVEVLRCHCATRRCWTDLRHQDDSPAGGCDPSAHSDRGCSTQPQPLPGLGGQGGGPSPWFLPLPAAVAGRRYSPPTVVPERLERSSSGLQPDACSVSAMEPWSRLRGSNPLPPVYKTGARPSELRRPGAGAQSRTEPTSLEERDAAETSHPHGAVRRARTVRLLHGTQVFCRMN